jgi:transcriptional regulator GlxA family with amidase domain
MPLDILSTCSKWMFDLEARAGYPAAAKLQPHAVDIQFHPISTSLSPVALGTCNYTVLPTTTISTCPPLDYLLIGGPDMTTFQLSPEYAEFVKNHVKAGKGIFCTCTGAMAIASTGVLDGKRATTNHNALEMAREFRPDVKWEKKQWVVDGNIWTAGGACAGMDMMAHWVVENYGVEVAKHGFKGLDYVPRDVEGKQLLL